ncbi:MAG: hypothetical protein E6Q97_01000 [Desulfurellales bacterium]|nr:MAG: hypothetical protein E6Q97_01000 [Desulfurellales bacterium]
MYAWQKAAEEFARIAPGKDFAALVGHCVAQGAYVWSTPTEFILAMPVSIRDGQPVHDDAGDTWYVHLAALLNGTKGPNRFLELAPFRLPWVAWNRHGGPLKRYRWARVARLSERNHHGCIR